MKIIIVGPSHPYRGGIADTNEALASTLQKSGHHTKIFTFKLQYPNFLFPGKTQFSEEQPPKGLEIVRCINSIDPINWYRIAKIINKESPDLVVFRYWIPFMAPCLGTMARNLKKNIKKIALTDNIIPHEKRVGDTMLTKYFVTPFDGFITLSTTVTEELRKFSNKPVMFHPHPMNEQLGQKIPKDVARKQLGLKEDGNYVLFFGLVRRYKGLDLLLEAFSEPTLKDSDIQLIIAAEFYEDPKKYHELIKRFGLENRVILHDRYIAMSEIKQYFSAADLVAQTYHAASQSGITPVAYWFNVPMLVTDVGGLAELVPHEKVGYVVSKDTQEIASSISDFFQNGRHETFATHIEIEKQRLTWQHFVESMTRFADSI